jgi:hypothetical protein
MRILYAFSKFSIMSVNKVAAQNIRQHHFLQPKYRVGWPLWDKLSRRGCGNSNTFLNLMKKQQILHYLL